MGDVGVAAAHLYYVQQGYIVLLPTTESSRYDLVYDDGEKLVRVQCKTTEYKKYPTSGYTVQLSTKGGNKSGSGKSHHISSSECDIVFVRTKDGHSYEFPVEVVAGKFTMVLTKNLDKYKI